MSGRLWQAQDELVKSLSSKPALVAPLATIGGVWVAAKLYRIASFTYFHFLRGSSLGRYQTASDDWALVTGASDGIGKGFAEELCHRGFNVVIHGRNETKLNKLKNDLVKRWPASQVQVLVFDVGLPLDAAKLEATLQQVKDLNLKLLVNNVGGKSLRPWFGSFVNETADNSREWVEMNARFHVEVTRILLPQLIKASPAAVVNNGSFGSVILHPYLSLYGGAKCFMRSWSESMSLEMQADGHDVQFYYLVTGGVQSRSMPNPVTITNPSSRTYASHALNKIGGSRRRTVGYWAHGIFLEVIQSMPTWMSDKAALSVLKQLTEDEKQGKGC